MKLFTLVFCLLLASLSQAATELPVGSVITYIEVDAERSLTDVYEVKYTILNSNQAEDVLEIRRDLLLKGELKETATEKLSFKDFYNSAAEKVEKCAEQLIGEIIQMKTPFGEFKVCFTVLQVAESGLGSGNVFLMMGTHIADVPGGFLQKTIRNRSGSTLHYVLQIKSIEVGGVNILPTLASPTTVAPAT